MLNNINEQNSSENLKIPSTKSARMLQLEKEGITIKLNKQKNLPMDLLIRRNENYDSIKSSRNKVKIPKPMSSLKNLKTTDSCEREIKYNHISNISNLSTYSLCNQNTLNNSFRKSIPLYKKKKLSSYLLRNSFKENVKNLQNQSFSFKKNQSEKKLRDRCLSEKKPNVRKMSFSNFLKDDNNSTSNEKTNLRKNLVKVDNKNNLLTEKENLRGGRIDLISSIYKNNKNNKYDNNYYENKNEYIIKIQSWWRKYLFKEYIRKVIVIQSFIRRFIQVKKINQKKKSTLIIQRSIRKYIQKKKIKKLVNIIKIQKCLRKYLKIKKRNKENMIKEAFLNLNKLVGKKYFEKFIEGINEYLNFQINIKKPINSCFISKIRKIKNSKIHYSVKLSGNFITKNIIPFNQIIFIQKLYKKYYNNKLIKNKNNQLKTESQNKLKNMFYKDIHNKLAFIFQEILSEIKFFDFLKILIQRIQKKVQQETYQKVKYYLNKNNNINDENSQENYKNISYNNNKETFYFSVLRKNLKLIDNKNSEYLPDKRIYNLLHQNLPKYFNPIHNRKIIPYIEKNNSHILRTSQIYNSNENNLLSKYINFFLKSEKDFDLISDSFIESRLFMKPLYNRNIFGIIKYSNELFKDIIQGNICQNCFCKIGEICNNKCSCHEEPEINVIKKIYRYDEYVTNNINDSNDYNIEIPEENFNVRKKIYVTNNPEDYIIDDKINVIRIKGTKFNRPVTESDEFFFRNYNNSTRINSNNETIEFVDNYSINNINNNSYKCCSHFSKQNHGSYNSNLNNNLLNYLRKNDENKSLNANNILKKNGNGLLAQKINKYIEDSKIKKPNHFSNNNSASYSNNLIFESNGKFIHSNNKNQKGNLNHGICFSDSTFKKENIKNLSNFSFLNQIPDFDIIQNKKDNIVNYKKDNVRDRLLNRNSSQKKQHVLLRDYILVCGENKF